MSTRQMRRARQRLLAKSADVKEVINKLERDSQSFADKAYKDFKEQFEPQIRAEAHGAMVTLFLGYMHIKHNYGKKRLTEFALDFNEFVDDMSFDEVTTEDIQEMIREETATKTSPGIDLSLLYKKMVEETQERKIKYAARRHKARK